ncbi:MAG: Mur ligase family protein [Coriobacteriia bacterium]|nr:Mur ligase family protein [Coriobacteriia bacterium]
MGASAESQSGYEAALAALEGALVFGIRPSLQPIRSIAERLGNPQDAFNSVQVTGTNGKTSVTRLVAAILEAHGVHTGTYTSPALLSETDRIEGGGAQISEELFAEAVAHALEAARSAEVEPTHFELVTAACLWAYRECGVEAAVLEVGMGGRWDATSVVSPRVSVITGVGLDHTEYLGSTRERIAYDKAHVIKGCSATVLGPGTVGIERVFLKRAAAMGVSGSVRAVRCFGEPSPVPEDKTVRFDVTARPQAPDGILRLDIEGAFGTYEHIEMVAPAYQAANIAAAVAAAEAYLDRRLDPAALRGSVRPLVLRGRFQVLAEKPWLVADGAHNPQAAIMLAEAIVAAWPKPDVRPTVVLGILADKDATGIVSALAKAVSSFVCVALPTPRALPADDLAAAVKEVTGLRPGVADSVAAGIGLAVGTNPVGSVATGSLYTAAEAIKAYSRSPSRFC